MAKAKTKVKVSPYLKKVGRSLGYAVGDALEQYNPLISSLVSGITSKSKSAIKNVKSTMASMDKGNISKSTSEFLNGPNFVTNLLDDLKTGNFYNTERDEKAALEAMGVDENSFNDSNEDWGDSTSQSAPEPAATNNSKAIIQSMGKLSRGVSRSIGKASAVSAEYIVKSNNRASKAIYDMTSTGFNQVSTILLDIDNKMDGFLNLSKPLATHMTNSAVFYTKATQSLNSIDENLAKLVKRTEYMDQYNQKGPGGRRISDKGSFTKYTSGGMFDIDSYLDMVKGNLIEHMSMAKDIFGGNAQQLEKKFKNMSLMETALSYVIGKITPTYTKDAMRNLNDAINGAIIGGLQRGGKQLRNSDNIVTQLLGSILFPKSNFKRGLNTKNYNKGPVQWDGIARKSLVEVIPTYLAKIYASLGGEEKYFDYNIGRFISIKNINAQNKYEEQRYANRAGGDFRKFAMQRAGNNRRVQREIDDYFLNAFRDPNGDFINLSKNQNNKEFMKRYGLSKESMEILISLIKDSREMKNKSLNSRGRNILNNFLSQIYAQNNAYSNMLGREEQSSFSRRVYSQNGFAKEVDKYNKSQSDYLRSIYQMVGNIYGSMRSDNVNNGRLVNNFNPESGKFNRKKKRKRRKNVYREHSNMDAVNDQAGEFFGMTEDEIESYIEDERLIGKLEDRKRRRENDGYQGYSISQRFVPQKIKDVIEWPFYSVTKAINTLTNGFNELFWGDGTVQNKGIINKIGESFDNITKKIGEKFNDIKESFKDKIKNLLKDRLYKSLGQSMKDEWGNIKKGVKNKYNNFKDSLFNHFNTFKEARDYYATHQDAQASIEEHAFGKKITKSGLAVLSEGELVIPSEYNPYYNGPTNKKSQVRKEQLIKNRFLGTFAEGNIPPREGSYISSVAPNGTVNYYKYVRNKKGNLVRNTVSKKEYDKYVLKQAANDAKRKVKEEYFKQKGNIKNIVEEASTSDVAGFIAAGVDTATHGFKAFVSQALFGTKKDREKDKKKIDAKLKDVMADAFGNAKGAMGIGALAGVGTSLLTGVMVGPIAGAAIGAGVGLLAKSKAAQDAIFGDYERDKDGNFVFDEDHKKKYKEGLLGDFGRILRENKITAKNTIMGAATGGVASTLLLGSPILGLVAGSVIGFSSKSASAQEFIFGKEITAADGTRMQEGGILPYELQNRIKKAAPNIGAGIIASMIAGPPGLGIAGKIIIGSALGYATTTNTFHEFLFGGDGKENKGLAGTIHDKVVGNIDGLFHNIKNEIKGFGKKLGKQLLNIGKRLRNRVRKISENKDGNHPILSKVAGVALKYNPISLAGSVIGGANNIQIRHNLKKGYDVYDKNLKRNLTAKEKMQKMFDMNIIANDNNGNMVFDENGNPIYNTLFQGTYAKQGNINPYLANIDNIDDLNELRSELSNLQDSKLNYNIESKQLAGDYSKRITNALGKGSAKYRKKIMKYIQNGDIDKAKELISNKFGDNEEANNLLDEADTEMSDKFTDMLKDKSKLKALREKGIISRGTSITSLLGAIDNEKALRFTGEKLEEQETENKEYNIIGLLHHIDAILSRQEKIKSFKLKGKYSKLLGLNIKNGLNVKSNAEELIQNEDGTYRTSNGELISKYEGDERLANGSARIKNTHGRGKPPKPTGARWSDKFGTRSKGKAKGSENTDEYKPAEVESVTRFEDIQNDLEESDTGSGSGLFAGGKSKIRSALKKLSKVKNTIISKTDFLGNVHQYTRNNQGELTHASNDSETKKSQKIINKFTNSVFSIKGISSRIKGLGGILSSFKEKLFGSEDNKKEGLLSKLFGENSFIGGLFRFFTGSLPGQGIKSILRSGIGSVITKFIGPALGPALLLAGFTNAFDSIVEKIGNLPFFKGNDTQSGFSDNKATQVTLSDGTTAFVQLDEDGNIIKDANGNYISTSDGSVISPSNVTEYNNYNSDTSYNTQFKRNFVTGTIKNSGMIAKGFAEGGIKGGIKAAENTSLGAKGIVSGGRLIKNAATSVGTKAKSVGSKFTNTKLGTKVKNAASKVGTKIKNAASSKIGKKSATSVATKATKNIYSQGTIVTRFEDIQKDLAEMATKKASTGANAVEKAANSGMLDTILSKVSKALENVPTMLKSLANKLPFIPKSVGENADLIVKKLYSTITSTLKTLVKKGKGTVLKKIAANSAKLIPIAGTVLYIGTAVYRGIECFTSAESVLGITQDATTGQKIIAALVGATNALIPLVGDLIPNKVLVNMFMTLAPKLGIDVSDLQEQREAATKEVEEFNEANGTDLTIEQYNKMNGKSSIISKGIDKVKSLGSSAGKGIKKAAKKVGSGIKSGISKIGDGITSMSNKAKDTINKMKESTASGIEIINKGGSLSDFLDVSDIKDEDGNPVSGFARTLVFGSRLASIGIVTAKYVGKKISGAIKPIINGAKKIIKKISNIGSDNAAYVNAGDPVGLWQDWSVEDEDGNPIGGFYNVLNGINKVFSTPGAGLIWVVKKLKEGFISIANSAKKTINNIVNIGEENYKYAQSGDIVGLWTDWSVEDDEGNPLGGLYSVSNGISKIGYTIPTVFHMIGNGIKDGIKNIIGDIDGESQNFNSALDALKQAAKDGDFGTLLKSKYEPKDDGPIGFIYEAGFTINKIFNVIGTAVSSVGQSIKSFIGGIAEDLWSGFTNTVSGGNSTNTETPSGGASGFISQYDPRYQSYKVSGQQFGAKGCGPAVAAMAAKSMGKNLSVSNAVSDARGYETSNGVTIDYFQKALGSKGIKTDIIAGGSSADMYSRLTRGEKVVLLGRDPMNTSKDNSPFGPNNHYVLANGIDKKGNVIVNDPELNGPRTYSPAILNSASVGIAGGRSGLVPNRLRTLFSGGGNVRNDATTQQVWSYLRTKLGMSEAAAAGVMGNMQQESGCEPDKHQKGGSAYGICQWDGGRKTSLLAQPNPSSLATQLAFLASELPNQYWSKSGTINDKDGKKYTYSSCTYDEFKAMTDVAKATIKFEAAFERADKPYLANRISYASQYYKMFTGKNYEYSLSDTTISSGDSSSSSVSSAVGLDAIMSGVTSALASGFAFLNTSSSSDSSTGSSGASGSVDGSADASASRGGKAKSYPTGQGNAQSFINIAKSQLGVIEGNDNITDYGKFMGIDGKAWCAAFVSWCMDKAFNGDKTKIKKALRGNPSASVSVLWDNFKKAGAMVGKNQAQAGDIVIYKNGSSHTGLVEAVDADGKVHTIEGNTSGGDGYERNGGMVARKQFYPNQRSMLTGFGRPDWAGAAGAGSGLGFISYDDLCCSSSGSNSTLLRSRAGSYNPTIRTQSRTLGNPHEYYGGASNITDGAKNILNTIKSSTTNSGYISKDTVAKLIESISNLLTSIANNTAPVEKIYNLLSQYYNGGGSSGVSDKKTTKSSNKKEAESFGAKFDTKIDANIQSLAGVLAELAKG